GRRSLKALLQAQGADVTGWTLDEITALSADGRVVVGNGRDPQGHTQAFRAMLDDTPRPNPPNLAVTALAWTPAHDAVDVSFTASGDLPGPTTVILAWSSDKTAMGVLGAPLASWPVTAVGSSGPNRVAIDASRLASRPAGAAYLVAIADPEDR